MERRPRILDITRLLTRTGHPVLTGIDRVELAYLDRFLDDPAPAFFLASTRRQHLLLGKTEAQTFRARFLGQVPWGPPDLRALLARRLPPARRLAEASLRRDALSRSAPGGLAARLAAIVPDGADVYNVGHSNLDAATLAGIAAVPGLRLHVLLHDTIPLDHPQFARAGTPAAFVAKIKAVADHAQRVVHLTEDARGRTEAHLSAAGRVPPGVTAAPGVTLAAPDPAALPPGLMPDRPYFVTIGTIEPRKNHALLLDVWEHFHATLPEADIPLLLILGSRGWSNLETFRRLDALPFRGRTLHEIPGLSDGAIAALLRSASALLFPSLAEGFGMPPLEALGHGVPVIAAPLPVYRETLGDNAVYADPADRYLWAQKTIELAERQGSGRNGGTANRKDPPSWDAHFNRVFTNFCD